jgi:hypothetical protein
MDLFEKTGLLGMKNTDFALNYSQPLSDNEILEQSIINSYSDKFIFDVFMEVVKKFSNEKVDLSSINEIQTMEDLRKGLVKEFNEREFIMFNKLFLKYFYIYEIDKDTFIDLEVLKNLTPNSVIFELINDMGNLINVLDLNSLATESLNKLIVCSFALETFGYSINNPTQLGSEYIILGDISNERTIKSLVFSVRLIYNISTEVYSTTCPKAEPTVFSTCVFNKALNKSLEDLKKLSSVGKVDFFNVKFGYRDHLRLLLLMIPNDLLIQRIRYSLEKGMNFNLNNYFDRVEKEIELSKIFSYFEIKFIKEEIIKLEYSK